MNTSEFYSLNIKDVSKAAVTAFFTGALIAIAGVVSQQGFDVFHADWHVIMQVALSGGIATFFGYLTKNFLSTPDGKFLGRIG